MTTKSQTQNLKRKLDKLSLEDKMNKIKHLALQEKVDNWRAWGLKAVRDRALGNPIETSPDF